MARRTRIKISVPIIVKEKKSEEETPIISPLQVTDFSSSSITTEFSVSTTKAEEVVKGVLCGKINPPTFDNADNRLLYGKGDVNLTFAGLNNNTEYYLRPYALSNLGYKYGDIVSQRTKPSPIPDEYQLVEWLRSDGFNGSYINTGVLPQNGLRIILKWQPIQVNTMDAIFGSRYDAEKNSFGITYGTYKRLYYGNHCTSYNTNFSTDTDYIINFNNIDGKLFINNILDNIAPSAETYNFPNPIPIWIFNMANWSGTVGSKKIYYCHLSVYNNYVRKLYPVYRKSDNKPGMYDIVNNQFYINQGTGEFIVGPDKESEE